MAVEDLIVDRIRSTVLAALMNRHARTIGELARYAALPPSRISDHPAGPLVLVAPQWPRMREPLRVQTYQQFSHCCVGVRTADWYLRFGGKVAIYRHLHIPRTTTFDSGRVEELSVGYLHEYRRYGLREDFPSVVPLGRLS